MNIKEAFGALKLKFTSANKIGVERATITGDEWNAIESFYLTFGADLASTRKELEELQEEWNEEQSKMIRIRLERDALREKVQRFKGVIDSLGGITTLNIELLEAYNGLCDVSHSADIKQVATESVTQPKIDFCYACGTASRRLHQKT